MKLVEARSETRGGGLGELCNALPQDAAEGESL